MADSDQTKSSQANIELFEEVIRTPGVDERDRAYYRQVLRDLYQKQAIEQRGESSTMARAQQSNYGHSYNNNEMSPYGTQVPSPPQAEPYHGRKRSIGLVADYPEAKRVSGQPSPVTPDSDDSKSWPRPLSSWTSNQERYVVDLTESDPPTPEREQFSDPHLQPRTQALPDPYAELNSWVARDNEQMAPADVFNQDFMAPAELAEFMVQPTAPGGGYGFQQRQQQQQQQHLPSVYQPAPFDFDALRVGGDSDDDAYGTFPLNSNEADAIEKLFDNIKDDEMPEDREPTPPNMTCTLKEYQRIGLTWLLKMERGTSKGGILADEMGLGKTIQALALICANPSPNPGCKTTLIIAPVALMRQWQKEIEIHVHPRHKLSVHLYHGSGKNVEFARLRQFDVVLTTFGTLTSELKQRESSRESMLREQEQRIPGTRKPKDRLALLGHECMWYRIIIDEAHNIKNRLSKCSKACAELMAKHRLCMTGTPMMNSVDELYPLLRFLRVEPYLGWPKFSMEIAKPAKSTNEVTHERAMKRIQILLRSIMIRRQKNSVVDGKPISILPAKHTMIDNVEFEDDEHALYKALEARSQLQFNKYLQKDAVAANYANVLVLLLRLRQACCHPHLIKDLSQPATEGIAEVDLLTRAEELDDNVIMRLKVDQSFECPICFEADPNPTIIIPCGHTVCGECVQKLIDPANRPVADSNDAPKCPHCRGELKAKLITDYKHFCKVHCPEKLESADAEDDEVAVSDISNSGSEESDEDAPDVDKKGNLAGFVVNDDEDDKYEADEADDNDSDLGAPAGAKFKSEKTKPKTSSKGKGKMRAKPKQTLAQLKKESMKNKAAKKRYLRRLDKTYISSAKTTRTVELLMEIQKNDPTEKTLIFSQFTSLLDLVEVPLFREKIKYQRYDGSMKMDQRADAVNAFMDDPEQNVMLVSIKAGNAGLNLWKASRVIILDPFWNPFIEEQAVDRAHRMPQPREVHVYRILIPETVEDRIKQLQDKKLAVINNALDENASKSLTRLSKNELKFLFGVR